MIFNFLGFLSSFISGTVANPTFIVSVFAFVVVIYALYRFIDFVRYRRV